eukprot:TRINITY_DN4194_c2_g1_i2.p2 TRINITY_DN4194_c2_g1~~TRINITY_DN4194_c2_g1_i2.p2  ORF type:complete len:200 (+),score=35.24 TRINITY_DN4194_c2_g1_i2:73-600(+)
MALRLALCGTSTHFKGTEEAYWLLILDCDNNGINRTAKLRTNGDMVNIMFREGMKTYIGVAQKDGSETGPWPCRGMYYHDDDGGPASGCPRGTFNLRVYQLRGEGRTVVFDGSYSDCAVSGQHYSLAVEIRNPATCREKKTKRRKKKKEKTPQPRRPIGRLWGRLWGSGLRARVC